MQNQFDAQLGVDYGKVALVEHDERWEKTADEVIELLWNILGDVALDIQHTGSTSIRGIPAKPILDISVGVEDVSCAYHFREPLQEYGIRIVGELVPGQIMCDMKNTAEQECVHIHFVRYNSAAWKEYILFRDYMNAFPEEARHYAAVKTDLARRFQNNRKDYTAGKDTFIKEKIAEAYRWKNSR